jgi:hypothetical protein
VHDEDADGGGDAGQLRRAVDLGVVHVETSGDAAGGDGLAQAVQEGIQSLVGIELGVRDEAAGVVERGLQEDLLLAAARASDPGAEEHVGLPDLIGKLGFVLFVRGGFVEQQLAFGEAAGAQEAIERGSRQAGLVPLVGHGQLAQQSGAGTMRVLALEPFDEGGGSGATARACPRSWRGLGRQRGQSVAAIAQRPIQQRVHRDLAAGGMGNVVEAGGDLLGAAREFAAGQRFQHQRRDEAVTEERDFFGFVVHRVFFLLDGSVRRKASRFHANGVWGGSGGRRGGGRMRRGGRREPDRTASPAGGSARRRTGSGERRSSRWIRAWPGRGGRSRARERLGQRGQRGAQRFGLRAEAANPELAALVGHRGRADAAGSAMFARGADGR